VRKVFSLCDIFPASTRNELIKLAVFLIKCKAMMGICIYWLCRHVIFGKRCKSFVICNEWVIFHN